MVTDENAEGSSESTLNEGSGTRDIEQVTPAIEYKPVESFEVCYPRSNRTSFKLGAI